MATLTATLPKSEGESASRATVAGCYSGFDAIFPACDLWDLTEGIYRGQASVSFEQAQRNQREFLLDEVGCGPGTRLLDIGCGYGTLLAQAAERRAAATGITLSREQVRRTRSAGLDVRLTDYRNLPHTWDGQFDAVVANGSVEHFAQVKDAVHGTDDAVYRGFFRTARRLIDSDSRSGRMATTIIHFERRPDPNDLLRNPFSFPRGSDEFHFALLARAFGGWYPVAGQLEHCASGFFELIHDEDGTDDYRRTSEEWLARVKRALLSHRLLPILARSLPVLLREPIQFALLLYTMLVSQSWNWQFRGPNPPTRLLRQTWLAR
jgi:cyclopropane-fatty-acyl-phospholipid synthase